MSFGTEVCSRRENRKEGLESIEVYSFAFIHWVLLAQTMEEHSNPNLWFVTVAMEVEVRDEFASIFSRVGIM